MRATTLIKYIGIGVLLFLIVSCNSVTVGGGVSGGSSGDIDVGVGVGIEL